MSDDQLIPIFLEANFQASSIEPLNEEEGGGPGRFKVTGSFGKLEEGTAIVAGKVQHSDKKNANKRVYTNKLFQDRVFKNENVQWRLKNKMMFGELDHPADGKTSLNRVSHIMTKLEEGSGGEILGEAIIFNTEAGKNLKAILEVTDMIGASSRGFGKLKGDGVTVDESSFEFKTVDFVAEPSTPGAYVIPSKEQGNSASPVKAKVSEDVNVDEISSVEEILKEFEERFTKRFEEMSEGQITKEVARIIENSDVNSNKDGDSDEDDDSVETSDDNNDTIDPNDKINGRTEMSVNTEALEEKVEELTERLDTIPVYQAENDELRMSMGTLEEALDEMAKRFKSMESQKDSDIADLETQLKELQTRYDAAEQLLDEQLRRSEGDSKELEELEDLKEQHQELQVRYDAAERLLDENLDMLKEAQGNLEGSSENEEQLQELQIRYEAAEELLDETLNIIEETRGSEGGIQERYDAAEELLDAFIEKAQEDQEAYNDLQERYDAAETLLQETLDMRVEDNISEYVEELTDGMQSNVKETLTEELSDCKTRKEVDEKFARLAPAMKGVSTSRVPLPGSTEVDKKQLDEASEETNLEQLEEMNHSEAFKSFQNMKRSQGLK